MGRQTPASGTTSLLEVAQCLGELAKAGTRPKRTIVFASWDAEEFGILGSTEWVEDLKTTLQQKAIAYLNVDIAATGGRFYVSATPSLRELMREVTQMSLIQGHSNRFTRVGKRHKARRFRRSVTSEAVRIIRRLLGMPGFLLSAWGSVVLMGSTMPCRIIFTG